MLGLTGAFDAVSVVGADDGDPARHARRDARSGERREPGVRRRQQRARRLRERRRDRRRLRPRRQRWSAAASARSSSSSASPPASRRSGGWGRCTRGAGGRGEGGDWSRRPARRDRARRGIFPLPPPGGGTDAQRQGEGERADALRSRAVRLRRPSRRSPSPRAEYRLSLPRRGRGKQATSLGTRPRPPRATAPARRTSRPRATQRRGPHAPSVVDRPSASVTVSVRRYTASRA